MTHEFIPYLMINECCTEATARNTIMNIILKQGSVVHVDSQNDGLSTSIFVSTNPLSGGLAHLGSVPFN